MRSALTLVLLVGSIQACLAAATLQMGGATLSLDDAGRVTSLRAADGQEHASPEGAPAFEVETDRGLLRPTAVTRAGKDLDVRFGSEGRMRLAVTEGQGFVLLKVADLQVPGTVRRLQLFSLPLAKPGTIASLMNASYDDRFATAVMATEINVHAQPVYPTQMRANSAGVTHTFERVLDPVKQGGAAARFVAASTRDDSAGWSMVRSALAQPLDLTGCKAVRAWVYGDGAGQVLKFQLNDGGRGNRDDTVVVNWTGWRQVVLDKPSLNTLDYARVAQVNYYYNSLPAKKTVTCVIDGVEALLGEGDTARVVLLEDFENAGSRLWTPPAGATSLVAESFAAHGIRPAGVGILACPRAEFEQTIVRFERAAGLPSPHPDGEWGKASRRAKRSYLLVADMNEADVDAVIAYAKRGSFDTVLIFQTLGKWCATTGHYLINTDAYPRGLDSLRDVCARIKKAGLHVGLHHLGASIYPPDPYVAPVPDKRLVRDAFADLAADVDAGANFIPTAAPPNGFPEKDVDYLGSGAVLQIGDELIHYASLSMEPPYGFKGCARGWHGTRAAAHARGDRVAHMHRAYGYYLFDMDTPLLDEIADNMARIVNTCGLDMVYWDGSEQLQGDHWYYNAKLQKAYYDRFRNKDILCQGSSVSHYSWHIHSRLASADGHGDLKGYLDERSPSFQYHRTNLLNLDIGWYSVFDLGHALDEFEYILNKSIGFDSSISFGIMPKVLRTHPFLGAIADRIAAYEKVRLGGKVPEATRAALRVPKHEYRLVTDKGGPGFQRVLLQPAHGVTDFGGKTNVWEVEVKEQPCRLAVEMVTSPERWAGPGPAYRSEKALLLDEFETLRPYGENDQGMDAMVIGEGKAGMTSQGVTQRFEAMAEGGPAGRFALYTATSTASNDQGWSAIGRRFEQPLDLSWHKGLGFWVRGDGHGGMLKLQLRDEAGGAFDFYLHNRFEGWRYIQVPRPEKDPIDYAKVRRLIFYYNGLPAKSTVSCGIDGVKALPALDEPVLDRPALEVDGQKVAWPVTLTGAQWLFAWPGEPTRVCAPGKETTLPAPPEMLLQPGRHTLRLTCGGPSPAATEVRVMLLPPERLPAQ